MHRSFRLKISDLRSRLTIYDSSPKENRLHIAICTAQVPFVYGGNEVLVDGLRDALTARGHKVVVIALPYKWYPHSQIVSSALAWRLD